MQKLMAIILAVIMVLSITAVAMADTAKTQDVTISYTVEESYEWSIPSGFDMVMNMYGDRRGYLAGNSTLGEYITIKDAVLLAGNTIELTVTTANAKDNKHHLKNGTAEVPYSLQIEYQEWTPDIPKHLVGLNDDGYAEMVVTFQTDEALPKHLAGEWSDTLTISTKIVKDTGSTDGYCNRK